MSGKVLLPPLNNAWTRHICSYLDAASLGCVAGVSKGFHLMAPSVDSSAGRIQKLVQKYRGQDGGLDFADFPGLDSSRIHDISHNGWVFGCLTRDANNITLLGSPSSVTTLKDCRFVSRSEHHLFACNANAEIEVHGLQGNLVATIPEQAHIVGCSELECEPNFLRMVTAGHTSEYNNARLSVWEVRDKELPKMALEHTLPQDKDKPCYIDACMRFGDLLALVTRRFIASRYSFNLWSYNLRALDKPPVMIEHPNHRYFSNYDTPQKFCSNARQLFLVGYDRRSIVAYIAENGVLKLHWEKREIISEEVLSMLPGRSILPLCASDRYLLVRRDRDHCERMFPPFSRKIDLQIDVLDTQTGESKGLFTCRFVDNNFKNNPTFTFQIWRDDILVVETNNGLHFWELPRGRRLYGMELRQDTIAQTIANTSELALLYQQKESGHLRLLDLSTMTPPVGRCRAPLPSVRVAKTCLSSTVKEESKSNKPAAPDKQDKRCSIQ